MEFTKHHALDLIEDALTDLESPFNCGLATGLFGAFYVSAIISEAEWEALLSRIPIQVEGALTSRLFDAHR